MVSSELWFGAEAGFYNGVATQSLRFEDGASAYLYRTPSSGGNRRTFTFSAWIKRGNFDENNVGGGNDTNIFSAGTSSVFDALRFVSQSFTSIKNILHIYTFDGSADYSEEANRGFRDVSSWYHIVFAVDTTQSTAGNRIKFYVNGELQTSVSQYYAQVPQNYQFSYNHTEPQWIGRNINSTGRYFDGYMAEVNFVDGTQYDASYFGETKNGVWIAKEASVTYGTNGFRLEFKQTGTGTASASTIGADTSGNNNHFTSSGIVASDCNFPDCPENNWCTLNRLEFQENNSGAFTAYGNLKWSNVNANINSTFGFGNRGGKYYWEYLYVSSTDSNQYQGVTLPKDGISLTNSFATGIALYFEDGTTRVDGVSGTGFAGKINGDNIIQFKLDLDNGTLEFGKNNTYISALTLPTSKGGWRAGGIQAAGSGGTRVFVANYGQDSSFAGNKTAQGNTDSNGFGDFYYAPPSGFLAVCSANLPKDNISAESSSQADDYFNQVLYSGNGGTQSITGVGFQPDWLWIKSRSTTDYHGLFDSSRGSTKRLFTNTSDAESTQSAGVTSFDSDGFSLGSNLGQNRSSASFVAWNWKSGGTTPTKTYKVVVVSDSGNKYRFRNSADSATFAQSAVTLDLQEGGTYTFDWSDSSAQGHPIRFSLTSDGTHGGGSEYTTGVVKDDSAYTTTITVASGVATLYYYCQNHSGMGGQINTNTTFGSTNFDGATLSIVQVNNISGFSIVLFTGTGSNTTVGHGLSTKPEWFLIKSRDSSSDFTVYHQDIGATKRTQISASEASSASTTRFNNTEPTDSVFTVSTSVAVNQSSDNYVVFCFSEIEGFSRFGSYTGNGNNDGTFVYTGFRPAWVLIKNSERSADWRLHDSLRQDINDDGGHILFPNGTSSENTAEYDIDFLSNGFKLRSSDVYENANNEKHIYMAFAEETFKFANAR